MVSNNHVVNPSVFKKMPYDSINDITPITRGRRTPFVLVVNPAKVPAKNAKELQAFLKAKPGAYNYASSGNGTIIHLAGEMFVDAAGVEVKHIPYKGVGPMVADLIGGQVEMGVVAVPAVQGHIKSGALRAIGVMGKPRVRLAARRADHRRAGLPRRRRGRLVRRRRPGQAAGGPGQAPARRRSSPPSTTPEVKAAMAKQDNVIDPTRRRLPLEFFKSEQDALRQAREEGRHQARLSARPQHEITSRRTSWRCIASRATAP